MVTAVEFGCYLINLERSPQRLQNMDWQLSAQAIAYERIDAVDARKITPDDFQFKAKNRRFYRDLSLGEVGCYLSHLKALQQFLATDLAYALILEDDCKLADDFKAIVLTAIEQHQHNQSANMRWDILKLEGQRKNFIPLTQLSPQYQLVEYGLSVPIATAAAIWTRAAAEKFIAKQSSPPTITRPIDCELQHPWEYDLQICGLYPPAAMQGGFPSEIAQRKPRRVNGWRKFNYELARSYKKINYIRGNQGTAALLRHFILGKK